MAKGEEKKKPHQQQIDHPTLICATSKERGSGDTSKYTAEGPFLSLGKDVSHTHATHEPTSS